MCACASVCVYNVFIPSLYTCGTYAYTFTHIFTPLFLQKSASARPVFDIFWFFTSVGNMLPDAIGTFGEWNPSISSGAWCYFKCHFNAISRRDSCLCRFFHFWFLLTIYAVKSDTPVSLCSYTFHTKSTILQLTFSFTIKFSLDRIIRHLLFNQYF